MVTLSLLKQPWAGVNRQDEFYKVRMHFKGRNII